MTRGSLVRGALCDTLPRCFWLDRPDRPTPHIPLVRNEATDLAIVGGGFTGLWAALLALEENPGRDVVVLEAERIGAGASGRNGGFADPSLSHGLENGLRHFPDQIEALEALGAENFEQLIDTLKRHSIDAHYESTGKLEVATAPCWVDDLREHYEALERFGAQPTWLDREQIRGLIHSPTYEAGVLNRRNGGVIDPALLCFGLASAVTRLGGRIFEGTRTIGVSRDSDGVALHTPHARLRARRAVLATNAYRSPLRRIRLATIPVWDYVLVSEPLSGDQMAAIGWRGRYGVGDTANQFHYYRLTDDDRILWGGYEAVYHFGSDTSRRREQQPAVFAMLAEQFFETFPQLEGLRFTHQWGGPIATTTRFCMDAGMSLGGRVAWAGGYTGLGVAASRFGARTALDLLERPDAAHLALDLVRRRPIPWPPEPLRYLAVQLTRHELARADRNGGRRGAWLRVLDRLGLGFDS